MEKSYKTISIDELIEKDLGLPGNPKRDKFDAQVQAAAIAFQLKELRLQKKLSQQQLADIAGIDKSQISKIEKGNRNLTIETIVRIVKALGGSFDLTIKVA